MSGMDKHPPETDFQKLSKSRRTGFLAEFMGFLGNNRKWWMLPMLAVILLLGALVLLGGTPLAPFIYTLF